MVAQIADFETGDRIYDANIDCTPNIGDILWVDIGKGKRMNVKVMQVCHWIGERAHKLCVYVGQI